MQALIAWLTNIWERLFPWVIVDPWEAGIRVRAGKWVKEVGPGLHFTIPFIDAIETINTRKQWEMVLEQTVETADRVSMLIVSNINYEVKHPKKLWLEVQDHDDSLSEECAVRIAAWVNESNYADVTIKNLVFACYPEVRRMGFRWGCEVLELGIKTLSKHRAYRVLTT